MAKQTLARAIVLQWRIARCSMTVQNSLIYRLPQLAKRARRWRAPRWVVQTRDFVPQTAPRMKSSMAPLCLAHRPVVPRESALGALASNQTAAAQASSLVAPPALVLVSGA